MGISVRERTIREIEEKLKGMNTSLNKIAYLESALRQDLDPKVKRFVWKTISGLYEERKMYDKAAVAMEGKAGIDVTFRERMESYLKSGELFAKAVRVEDAEKMFVRALREANSEQKQRNCLQTLQ